MSSKGRGKTRRAPACAHPAPSLLAHNIEAKERTVDVLNDENRNRDFSSMMLSEPVLKGLKDSGFLLPSPIQLAAIPQAKIGLDMIVQAKSGTGKTCVYVVTALEMIRPELPGLQVVVIAPTREIALQGLEVAAQIGRHLPDMKIASFIGGMPVAEDKIKALHCQLAVGTPGRIRQLLHEGILSADTVRLAILDEADKLLEASFLADITTILQRLPTGKQVLALSATYPEELARIVEKFMRDPQHVRLGKDNQVLHGIRQFALAVEASPVATRQNQIKQAALLSLLSSVSYSQCLVFSNSQLLAQSVTDFLNSRGFPAICISAGQDQDRRIQAMQSFKQFNCRILCSTDLTARGIDAENVNLVINLDVPWDHNTYLHRIGRAGRFGGRALAISLAPRGGKDFRQLQKIVQLTGSQIHLLPDILPKDIVNCDLPILECPDEVDEEDEKEKVSKSEAEKVDKVLPDAEILECCEPGQEKVGKTGGKIRRRGKKGKQKIEIDVGTAAPVLKPLSKVDQETRTFSRIDPMDSLRELLFPNVENCPPQLLDFAEIETLASQLASGGQPSENLVARIRQVTDERSHVDVTGQRVIGRLVGELSASRQAEWDRKVAKKQQLTSRLPLPELIEKLAAPAADGLSELTSRLQLSEGEESGVSCTSSSSCSTHTDSEEDEEAVEHISEEEEEVDEQLLPGVDTSRGLSDYRDWLQAVAQQRQYIQQYEYWRYVNFYFSQK